MCLTTECFANATYQPWPAMNSCAVQLLPTVSKAWRASWLLKHSHFEHSRVVGAASLQAPLSAAVHLLPQGLLVGRSSNW